MNFLRYEVVLGSQDSVRVDLSGVEANVRLMDEQNFRQFKAGNRHKYFGGHYKQSPAIIHSPSAGRWHVVIDTGGRGGVVRAAVSIT